MPTVVQTAAAQAPSSASIVATLPAPPTIGNTLVVFVCERVDNDPGDMVVSPGVWTQVGPSVYSGNGTNWPMRCYTTRVTSVAQQSVTLASGQTQAKEMGLVELTPAEFDTGVSASNTAACTALITPLQAKPTVLLSGVFARTDVGPLLSPVAGMTEWTDISRLGCNYREIDPTSGSYTVGSTGNGANSSMLGSSWRDIPPSGGLFIPPWRGL